MAAIGQAGENLSEIACVGVDKHRQYGRGGAGAVMDSRMLKAIVVDGEIPIKYDNEEALAGFMKGKKLDRGYFKSLVQDYYKHRGWSEKGVPG